MKVLKSSKQEIRSVPRLEATDEADDKAVFQIQVFPREKDLSTRREPASVHTVGQNLYPRRGLSPSERERQMRALEALNQEFRDRYQINSAIAARTRAYELAARTNTPEVVAILARAVMEICAGEVRQQSIRYHYTTSVDEYMRRIEAKTATLLAACCDIGALLGGLDETRRSALRSYGRLLGLAFQIADDVLDYTGTEGEVGKPIGHDILEGFATLPVMLASIDLEDDRRLSEHEAREIVEAVRNSNGPQQALDQARDHAEAARSQLKGIGGGEAASALSALAGYVVSRKL